MVILYLSAVGFKAYDLVNFAQNWPDYLLSSILRGVIYEVDCENHIYFLLIKMLFSKIFINYIALTLFLI